MAFTLPPTPPNSGDPANFNPRADAFLGWFPTHVTELNLAGFPDMPVRAQIRGTAAVPIWSFKDDPDTGMWSPGANILAWSTGGQERLRLTSAGLLTSSTAIVQSQQDATAGRLMTVGYGGIGGAINTPFINLDADYYGIWGNQGQTEPPTAPPDGLAGNARWAGMTGGGALAKFQMALKTSTAIPAIYFRTYNDTEWRAWVRALTSAEVVQSQIDATAGRLLTVGYAGWGGLAITAGVDAVWANLTQSQLIAAPSIAGRPTDKPVSGSTAFIGQHVQGTTTRWGELVQEATGSNAGRLWGRTADAGVTQPWRRYLDDYAIVGTVASDTNGIPTGAIIERGSNANGEFTRWADGTQICWRATAITTSPAAFSGPSVDIDGSKLRIGRWR